MRFTFSGASTVLCLTLLATPQSASAQTLTGATVFSTNATGSAFGNDIWNTVSNDFYYNLWVSRNGTAINGPTNAQADLSALLSTPGTYHFTIFGNPGNHYANHGLNLFFDGSATPGISVFAATAFSSSSTPVFTTTSGNTLDMGGFSTPGAGTLSYSSQGHTVTLTSFRWEDSTVQNQDLVSALDRTPGMGADNQGSFTLQVTNNAAVPEPSTVALALVGGLPVLRIVKQRRRTQ